MDEKTDMLFLEKGCPLCGVIRAELDVESVSQESFRGSDGQRLHVFATLSVEASKVLLEKFGLAGRVMPVVVTWEGEVRDDVQGIIAWLRRGKMTV